jgi:membrane protease YdiL (CAAX protease family)
VFGIGHAYQGRNGVILTLVLALFLGLVAWWTKSLVPGQLLHVAIDLVNGIAVGAALRRNLVAPVADDSPAPATPAPPDGPGVDPSPAPPA